MSKSVIHLLTAQSLAAYPRFTIASLSFGICGEMGLRRKRASYRRMASGIQEPSTNVWSCRPSRLSIQVSTCVVAAGWGRVVIFRQPHWQRSWTGSVAWPPDYQGMTRPRLAGSMPMVEVMINLRVSAISTNSGGIRSCPPGRGYRKLSIPQLLIKPSDTSSLLPCPLHEVSTTKLCRISSFSQPLP